jgi:choline transport protein
MKIIKDAANIQKSYICGATNVFSWLAICSGIAIIAPQLILGLAVFWIPGYAREPWHAFLVYQAVNLVVLVFNIYLVKRANVIHDLACKPLNLPSRSTSRY